jgi:HSP20 family protein
VVTVKAGRSLRASDAEHIAASYDSGVLTLRIPVPVAEQTKPRRISIASKGEDRHAINA